ncbi:MAG: DUF3299 domain-containing protein [Synechococcales cyanobacterium CRU_2_2]|nr:DUF3299 domain-containing protein [Synechococcales cyanobacterium CRU_2_2]
MISLSASLTHLAYFTRGISPTRYRQRSQGWGRRLRAMLLFLLSLAFALSMASAAPAQAAREITWDDLQPAKAAIADPLAHLPPEQYANLTTVARTRWWIETGETSANGPEAKQAARLSQSLAQQGVDVDRLLAELNQSRTWWQQQSEAINPQLEGQSVKLAGFVLPLEVDSGQNARPGQPENLAHDAAKVRAAQAQALRDRTPWRSRPTPSAPATGAEPLRFLLVPYIGACVHVPPPAANQMIYVEPSTAVAQPGLFDRVWIEGHLRRQPGTYDLFLVDGVRQVRASYALDLKAITPYEPDSGWLSGENFHFQGPWWQTLQARASALVTGTLVNMRGSAQPGETNRYSPAALGLGILIAFGYGVIHTLGPGHGKAVIISYFVGEGGSIKRGVTMGLRVAVFHVFSAILVAIATDTVVRQTAGSAPASYQVVRLISYGSIALIGAWMLWSATQPEPLALTTEPSALSLRAGTLGPVGLDAGHRAANPLSPNLLKTVLEDDNQINFQLNQRLNQNPGQPHQSGRDCGCYACIDPSRSGEWLSLAIGAVPCSGALLVLIYGLANDLLWPAVLMVVAISAGMAIALAGIGMAAIGFRQWADQRIGDRKTSPGLLRGIRIAGSVCVLLIGTFLFGLTLSSSTLPT